MSNVSLFFVPHVKATVDVKKYQFCADNDDEKSWENVNLRPHTLTNILVVDYLGFFILSYHEPCRNLI